MFKKCTERNVSKNAGNGKFQINEWNGMYKTHKNECLKKCTERNV